MSALAWLRHCEDTSRSDGENDDVSTDIRSKSVHLEAR